MASYRSVRASGTLDLVRGEHDVFVGLRARRGGKVGGVGACSIVVLGWFWVFSAVLRVVPFAWLWFIGFLPLRFVFFTVTSFFRFFLSFLPFFPVGPCVPYCLLVFSSVC